MFKRFNSGFLSFVILGILITLAGCVTYDVVNVEDTNISYNNFSSITDTEFGTIITFKHICSFDIINKNSEDANAVNIQYAYCPSFEKPLSPCQEKGSISIDRLRPNEVLHKEILFTDYVIDDTLNNKRTFQFNAIKTVYVKRE